MTGGEGGTGHLMNVPCPETNRPWDLSNAE